MREGFDLEIAESLKDVLDYCLDETYRQWYLKDIDQWTQRLNCLTDLVSVESIAQIMLSFYLEP